MTLWIDKKLAVGPMPSEDLIADLAKTFKAVVVLLEDWELDYDIQIWLKFGLKVKHLPIPDFGIPSLDDLHGLIDWIKRETEDGRAVFVHCYAGIGRSGMVAAAYLISKGYDVDAAIEHVRACVSGAIEVYEQEQLLRLFAKK
ncbi:MAG: dual specificity protein phosphatase family protein [Euryarchaeota archaeon]|nr:dual specificity protein phosphatase family protein [Euryarchaeota archaeon]